MAGPIIEALLNMRQNRMERRQGRIEDRFARRQARMQSGGLIRSMLGGQGLIQPVPYREAIQSVSEYLPEQMRPRPMFASLGGNRSAAQDRKGTPPVVIEQRPVATDSDAPDTEPSRPDRIDGKDPIESVENLPPPPDADQMRSDRITAEIDAITARLDSVTDPYEQSALRGKITALAGERARLDQRREKAEDARKKTAGYTIDSVQGPLNDAINTGNFSGYEAAIRSLSGPQMVNKDGEPIDPERWANLGPDGARSAVLNNTVSTITQFNSYADMPPDKRVAMLSGLSYVYPFKPANPARITDAERRQYVKGLSQQLMSIMVQSGQAEDTDADLLEGLEALASEVLRYKSFQ